MSNSRPGRRWAGTFHYATSIVLALALVPLLKHFGLPIKFDWGRLSIAYWLVLAAQSIFVAVILYAIAVPASLAPLWQRLRRNSARVVFLVAFFAVLTWATSWLKALVLFVDIVALLEYREGRGTVALGRTAKDVIPAALYLFVGFLLVFAYNDIVLSERYFAEFDKAFNGADQWLLDGLSVWTISDWARRVFPASVFRFLEFVYFGMFAQIGAAMILSAVYRGKNGALQFVGTILSAYYIALLIFFLWPSQGPYFLSPMNSQLSSILNTSAIQRTSIANAQALWQHAPIRQISTDYYIAFPCMHIAQPLIVMWFLRGWRRMVLALAAYDALLIVAVILLEWHYVVDILGGVMVAALAIALMTHDERSGKTAPAGQFAANLGTKD